MGLAKLGLGAGLLLTAVLSQSLFQSVQAAPAAAPAPVVQQDTVVKVPTVLVSTDMKSYRAGDPVQLRIVNETGDSYTYNPCTRTVERLSGTDTWTEVKEDRICTMIAHVLDPNATRTERTELGEQLTPGSYRLVVRFTRDAANKPAQSIAAYTLPITVAP